MTLVEGFDDAAVALARLLANEGRDVTLAGAGPASAAALELRSLGVEVRENADLDADPGEHDEAFLDVWTPEVAPRVTRLRASGCVLRCLGDLVLERATVPTIGVTGTAGKTTTTAFLVELLHAGGTPVQASTTGRAGNLWPTAEHLEPVRSGVVALELTSSHLCFTTRGSTVAVVTSFWPDHIELHGSLERYRAAKEAIVRRQSPSDVVVVNEDDAGAVAIAAHSPGRRIGFSAVRELPVGVFLRGTTIVVRSGDDDRTFARPPGLDGPRLQGLLGALATTLAVGAPPERLPDVRPLPFRNTVVGRRGATLLVDDSMAATPAKTTAALRELADRSIVLVAGGELQTAGRAVHASPSEKRLLEAACAEARRAAQLVVVFGPAGERVVPRLDPERTVRAPSLGEAIVEAGRHAGEAGAILVSPMFPLELSEREGVATALRNLSPSRE